MRNLTLVFSNEATQNRNTRKALQRVTSIGALIGGAILFFFLGGLTAKLAFGAVGESRMDLIERRNERNRARATSHEDTDTAGSINGDRAAAGILGATIVNLRGTIRCANTTQVGANGACSKLVFEEAGTNGRTYTLDHSELVENLVRKAVAIQGQLGANGHLAVTQIRAL